MGAGGGGRGGGGHGGGGGGGGGGVGGWQGGGGGGGGGDWSPHVCPQGHDPHLISVYSGGGTTTGKSNFFGDVIMISSVEEENEIHIMSNTIVAFWILKFWVGEAILLSSKDLIESKCWNKREWERERKYIKNDVGKLLRFLPHVKCMIWWQKVNVIH